MSDRSATHSTFVIERNYDASPARVFAAWADANAKGQWFGAPGEQQHELDFREGGREHHEGQFGEGGPISRFDAYYHEVVDDLRLVYDYEMRVNGERLSVSLASIELTPVAAGTRLTLTEQGIYFDDLDNTEQRKEGTIELLESLAKAVED